MKIEFAIVINERVMGYRLYLKSDNIQESYTFKYRRKKSVS